jgi:hypothetical protein
MVDLETVKNFSQFLALRGPRFMSQNLIWSGTKFLNLCSNDLQGKIEEASQGYETIYKTGPVYYKLAMSMIMTVTPESIQVIDHALQQLKVLDFDGENVVEFNSTFRSLHIMLHNNDKLFGDEMTTLINGYCTSSTDKFNARMQVMFVKILVLSQEDQAEDPRPKRYDIPNRSNAIIDNDPQDNNRQCNCPAGNIMVTKDYYGSYEAKDMICN